VASVLDICRPPLVRYLQGPASPSSLRRARAESHSKRVANVLNQSPAGPLRVVDYMRAFDAILELFGLGPITSNTENDMRF
jgi:hypothetical protein